MDRSPTQPPPLPPRPPALPSLLPPALPPAPECPQQASAPALPPENPSAAEEDPQPRPRPGWLGMLSSWTVSSIIHLAALIGLGLLTVVFPLEQSAQTSIFAIGDDTSAPLDRLEALVESRVENQMEQQLQAVPLLDPGASQLGQLASTATADARGSMLLSDLVGEIGGPLDKGGRGFSVAGEGRGGATFFGVPAGGNRFVFVVDGSMSMLRNGWDDCKQELLAAVTRLKPEQYFYVIIFARDSYRMFGDRDPQSRMLPASKANLYQLERWLYAYENHWGTKPLESMKYAVGLRPDAVYFLTDGKIQDDTPGWLRSNNRREDDYGHMKPRCVVHTLGFYAPDGQDVLTLIAQENGGTYRYVPRPPGRKPGKLPPKPDKPQREKKEKDT